MADQLLVISLGLTPQRNVLLQACWVVEPGPGGRRRSDIAAIGDQATLLCRLTELAAAMFAPIGAEVVPDVGYPALEDSLVAA